MRERVGMGKKKKKAAKAQHTLLHDVTQSLVKQYASIYLVNLIDDSYVEVSSSDVYKSLEIAPQGKDFFTETRKNNLRNIHPDDLPLMDTISYKEHLVEAIAGGRTYTVTYRLLMGDEAVYARLSAVLAEDGHHVIVGVADVNDQVRLEQAVRQASRQSETYSHIAQSLARRYATIYYVDIDTGAYVEFSSSNKYKELNVPSEGSDFFAESRHNIPRNIHPDDVDAVLAFIDREQLIDRIDRTGQASITYRLMLGGEPTYACLRAVWADDHRHLIVGVSDVDSTMRREIAQQEAEERSITYAHIAQSLANRYDSIYYVDTKTDSFTEYASTDEYKSLNVQSEGADFFASSAESILRLVYPEDREFALRCMDKRHLLGELEQGASSLPTTGS